MSRLLLYSLSAFFLLLGGCGEKIEPGTREEKGEVIRGLTLSPVAEVGVSGAEAFVGTVESRDRGVLVARVDGQVGRIVVREGDRVSQGALLLTIVDNQAEDRLREAQAAMEEAREHLASAESRAALAQKTFDRYRQLFENEAVTAQEMDRVTTEREVARQSLQAARAAVQRAESAQRAARTVLSHTQVEAPYDAQVVDKRVEEGSTVMPGTPLLSLDRSGGWRVRAALPEAMAGRVKPGDPVQVEIPALGRTVDSTLTEVLTAADPRSRTFEIKASLPEEADLAAGLFARIAFPGRESRAILVPAEAVLHRGQLRGIYVVEEGVLRYRLVKTGRAYGDRLEILSGLRPGEVIVTGGAERAHSGARVEG